MYRESVWYPNTVRDAAVVALLLGMTALHFTELVGLMDAGLLFNWLPIQLAYDLVYTLVAVVILYWVYTVAPDIPEEFQEPATGERSTDSDEGTEVKADN